jgi:hypothetical protein
MMILKTSRANLSSNDQCSLDLPFAATKSLTARVGPTPVFTRGSGATYIGSDGLIHGVDTSTTSNTIGTGSRTFTLAATTGQDQFWRAGDVVEASNGSNFMVGTVTSYDAATQSLVCNMTSTGGSGTFTSWRVGYRGPRFDHTSAGVCRGLLIEGSRTNAFQHSSNFKDTTSSNYWANQTATTITVDQIASPDGGVNADLLSTSTSSFDCFTRRNNFWAGSTQYTYSIFVKRGPSNYRYVGFYIGAGATVTQFPYFDFDNPTTVQIPTITSGTINSTRVDAYPNGWYRVIITFTTAATPITLFGGVYISASNGALQESSTAGNNCYIWGIQSELGSFPTSYIPTTTGSVVRSADVCSITGANFTSFYNQPEGTMLADVTPQTVDQLAVVVGVNTTTFQNSHLLYKINATALAAGKRWVANTNVAGPTQSSLIPTPTDIAVSRGILSYAYKLNDMAFAANGTLIGTDNTGTMPFPTAMRIGGRDDGLQINGHLAAIRYYKKRLPNAKLVTLTT